MSAGDRILVISCCLNMGALMFYCMDGLWIKSVYFLGALLISVSLIFMK